MLAFLFLRIWHNDDGLRDNAVSAKLMCLYTILGRHDDRVFSMLRDVRAQISLLRAGELEAACLFENNGEKSV